jgi:hypothetical protein
MGVLLFLFVGWQTKVARMDNKWTRWLVVSFTLGVFDRRGDV